MDNFKWTDKLVREMIWSKIPLPDHYIGNVQKCLDEFKQSKQSKKDYEILSFSFTSGCMTLILPKTDTGFANGLDYFSEDELLKDESYKIHSIKRLSDSEVFTVGDYIKHGTCHAEIAKFDVIYDEIAVFCKGRIGYTGISSIYKVKRPLFTTTDGVDIYKGDNYVLIWDDYSLGEGIGGCTNENMSHVIKRFSTKEAAEEYILFNKKLLSLNDLLDNWNEGDISERKFYGESPLFKNFKKAAQQNLNK